MLGDTFREHLKGLNCEISPGHTLLVLATEAKMVKRKRVIAPKGYHAALLQSSLFCDNSFRSFFDYIKKSTTSQISRTDDGQLQSPSSRIVREKQKARPVRSPAPDDGPAHSPAPAGRLGKRKTRSDERKAGSGKQKRRRLETVGAGASSSARGS